MKYSVQYHVVPATFHVISWKVDFLWDSIRRAASSHGCIGLLSPVWLCLFFIQLIFDVFIIINIFQYSILLLGKKDSLQPGLLGSNNQDGFALQAQGLSCLETKQIYISPSYFKECFMVLPVGPGPRLPRNKVNIYLSFIL